MRDLGVLVIAQRFSAHLPTVTRITLRYSVQFVVHRLDASWVTPVCAFMKWVTCGYCMDRMRIQDGESHAVTTCIAYLLPGDDDNPRPC